MTQQQRHHDTFKAFMELKQLMFINSLIRHKVPSTIVLYLLIPYQCNHTIHICISCRTTQDLTLVVETITPLVNVYGQYYLRFFFFIQIPGLISVYYTQSMVSTQKAKTALFVAAFL